MTGANCFHSCCYLPSFPKLLITRVAICPVLAGTIPDFRDWSRAQLLGIIMGNPETQGHGALSG